MGVEVVFNHADYRLISSKVLNELANFKEVNLFLRGLVPLIGFKSSSVYYERKERIAGKSHYPLSKMISLALDGITSLSIKPLRMISFIGFLMSFISIVGLLWAISSKFLGLTVAGWTSIVAAICLLSSIQLICIGIIGEYIGKIYSETKARPRFIIEENLEETVNAENGDVLDTEASELVKAFDYYEQAAAQGFAPAQNDYGIALNSKGQFVDSFNWIKKAAEQGYAPAQYHLAGCYQHAWGTRQNIDESYYYYITDIENKKYRVSIKINLNKLPFLKVGDTIKISYTEKEVSEILSIE